MALNQAKFDYVRTLVQQRSAIVLDNDKRYLAESRLLPMARREGFQSVEELVLHLERRPHDRLHEEVVDAMATHETSFFRDVYPFEALRRFVFPDLVSRRTAERRLNVWCAASSTGQEPFSIAMMLAEHRCVPSDWKIRLLGTDLSESVLDRARAGCYTQSEINRGLPASYLVKYFQKHGMSWQLRDDVRRMVDFRPLNLIEPWPLQPMFDVVFLRNVLIYFDMPTRKRILLSLRSVMRPDGYLFLGGAETALRLDDTFEWVPLERAGCYRLRGR